MRTSRSKAIIFLVAISLTLAASSYIYNTIVNFRNVPFSYDSAGHAYEGLRIAGDLRAGDMVSFIADTYRQGFWPFFHSWLLAPAFVFSGNTYAVARGVSLFCFLIFNLMLYFVALEMSDKRGHWIGLISVCLSVTSLPLLVLSAMSMSEAPGLMMTFISLFFYLKAIRKQKLILFVLTGVFMALTAFTKWHHGAFVIGAVILTQLTGNRKLLSGANYSLILPFLFIMLVWFIYPQHMAGFYKATTFQPHYYEFWSLDNWLYYPISFLEIYNSLSIVAVIIAAGFILSLKDIKDPKVRLLAIHVLIGLILMTIKLDNRHRYIITIVPSVWILGSAKLIDTFYNIKSQISSVKIKKTLAVIMLSGILIIAVAEVPGIYREYPDALRKYNYYSDERIDKAYKFISENVDGHDRIAVFGTWDYYNSPVSTTIKWNIEVRRADDLISGENKREKANYFLLQLLKNRDKESFRNFIHFLENKDLIVEEYNLLSFMKLLDIEAYQDFRSKTVLNPFSDKITDIHSIDDRIDCVITIYNESEGEINSYAEEFFSNQEQWIEYEKETFSDTGITINIYKRKVLEAGI